MTRHQSFAPSTGAFIVVPEENEKSEPFSNRKQVRIFLVWWARVDSNHRSWKQQIYSLSPLATREHAHIHFLCPSPDDLLILSWRKAFVNCFLRFSSNAFSVQRNGRAKAGKALQPCGHGKVGEKSQPEEIDRKIARKTRDNMWKVQDFFISALKNTVRRDILKT